MIIMLMILQLLAKIAIYLYLIIICYNIKLLAIVTYVANQILTIASYCDYLHASYSQPSQH